MTPHDMIFDKIDALLARADVRLAAILRAEPRGLVKVIGRTLVGLSMWKWVCQVDGCGKAGADWDRDASHVHDMARRHAHYCHLGQDYGLDVAS